MLMSLLRQEQEATGNIPPPRNKKLLLLSLNSEIRENKKNKKQKKRTSQTQIFGMERVKFNLPGN